jgi:hypothetical protein
MKDRTTKTARRFLVELSANVDAWYAGRSSTSTDPAFVVMSIARRRAGVRAIVVRHGMLRRRKEGS